MDGARCRGTLANRFLFIAGCGQKVFLLPHFIDVAPRRRSADGVIQSLDDQFGDAVGTESGGLCENLLRDRKDPGCIFFAHRFVGPSAAIRCFDLLLAVLDDQRVFKARDDGARTAYPEMGSRIRRVRREYFRLDDRRLLRSGKFRSYFPFQVLHLGARFFRSEVRMHIGF